MHNELKTAGKISFGRRVQVRVWEESFFKKIKILCVDKMPSNVRKKKKRDLPGFQLTKFLKHVLFGCFLLFSFFFFYYTFPLLLLNPSLTLQYPTFSFVFFSSSLSHKFFLDICINKQWLSRYTTTTIL